MSRIIRNINNKLHLYCTIWIWEHTNPPNRPNWSMALGWTVVCRQWKSDSRRISRFVYVWMVDYLKRLTSKWSKVLKGWLWQLSLNPNNWVFDLLKFDLLGYSILCPSTFQQICRTLRRPSRFHLLAFNITSGTNIGVSSCVSHDQIWVFQTFISVLQYYELITGQIYRPNTASYYLQYT